MNLIITLTVAGADTGPFNLYSDIDGFLSAFENNVSKISLVDGYVTANVPDGTTKVKVQSVNEICNNSIIEDI